VVTARDAVVTERGVPNGQESPQSKTEIIAQQ
jgi:hypothetical protein